LCVRLLCTYYSVYRYVCAYYFFYTHRRRRSVAGSTRAIGVMKYRGPSRDVLVFFFFFCLSYIYRYYFAAQPVCRNHRGPRGREAHNKGNATRFDFERARSRHLTPWPTDTDRPAKDECDPSSLDATLIRKLYASIIIINIMACECVCVCVCA